MRKNILPVAPEAAARPGIHSAISPRALQRWNPGLQAAAESDEPATISIMDVIGYDYWTGEGVTAKRVDSALRYVGAETPVTVNINSPGGDMFEGLAIYNLLRAHKGQVTTKVLGVAASAASIVAMGGDEIQIARAGFFMVHNAWVMAAGNRHDLREIADWLEPFDKSMVDIYTARSGLESKAVASMLDAESWIGGSEAVDKGFADELLAADKITDGGAGAKALASVRRIEAALRECGMPAAEAKRLISDIKSGARDAVSAGERDATDSGREAVLLQVDPLPRISFPL